MMPFKSSRSAGFVNSIEDYAAPNYGSRLAARPGIRRMRGLREMLMGGRMKEPSLIRKSSAMGAMGAMGASVGPTAADTPPAISRQPSTGPAPRGGGGGGHSGMAM